jgi:hypothetical protein
MLYAATKLLLYLSWRVYRAFSAENVMTVLGLWCLIAPLLLWISWSQTVFLVILGSALLSAALICAIATDVFRRAGRALRNRDWRSGAGAGNRSRGRRAGDGSSAGT